MFRRGFSNLFDSPVKLDNHMIWDGKRFPFYETYDIRFYHPRQLWSFFVRYAMHVPSAQRHEAFVSITSLFADQKGKDVKLEQQFPLLEHDVVHANRFITVGTASLSLAEALGCVEQNDQTIRWELGFEDPTQSEHIYPWFVYTLPFPCLKFLTPRFSSFVSGQIFVNHHSRDFQHLKVFQSHRYGSSSKAPHFWIQCSDFEEDETAVLEGLMIERGWPKASKKKWIFLNLIYESQRYSFCRLWCGNKRMFSGQPEDSTVTFEKGKLRFTCHVKREGKTTGLSLLAAIQIKIYKKQHGIWAEHATLTSKGGGVLEEVL